jgi:hypothetical protein
MDESHAEFSRAGAQYVNSEAFKRRPWPKQEAIRKALQQAQVRGELPEDVRQDMEAAGY